MDLSTQPDDIKWNKSEKETDKRNFKISADKILIYAVLIILAIFMLLPFFWMLSASLKLDKDVFVFPIQWIPAKPQWENYKTIWTRIPFLRFFFNTTKLTVIITLLQLATSSFAVLPQFV